MSGIFLLQGGYVAGERRLSKYVKRVAGRPPVDGVSFPKDFVWGVTTSAYQIEGAVAVDGRGVSIWDTFAHTPGRIAHGDTADVADDHYHRYKQDVALMRELGVNANSMTISWSRIFPEGAGAPNGRGAAFYDRLLDEMLAAGITPFCTFYHWELPQALQDRGGWENQETGKAFAEYVGYMTAKLSDRIRYFLPINEPRTFIELGYRDGTHAPGLKLSAARVAQISHNVMLAHGLGVQSIRAAAKHPVEVGIVDNTVPMVPAVATPEHITAAKAALREENAMFMTVLQEGRYTEAYLRRLGPDAPKFTAEELKIISTPIDFLGLNIYSPAYVRADESAQGYAMIPFPASYPRMLSPWLTLGPEAAYWLPRLVSEVWGRGKDLYVHENGCSCADVPAADGKVYDTDRVMYLRSYLTQVQRAVAEGYPVQGYLVWSLMDNFEWADGYEKRFGLYYVDFKTQQRTAKLSADWYRQVIAAKQVM